MSAALTFAVYISQRRSLFNCGEVDAVLFQLLHKSVIEFSGSFHSPRSSVPSFPLTHSPFLSHKLTPVLSPSLTSSLTLSQLFTRLLTRDYSVVASPSSLPRRKRGRSPLFAGCRRLQPRGERQCASLPRRPSERHGTGGRLAS